ncbi:MAG: hypothetical protein UDB11_03080 [Peptococcaceae bacterium]|nr:hypothetical protein [Peptococcaceae bacterium]
MKKIKTTIIVVAAIAAMAVSVWGDRQLDVRYAETDHAPVAVETVIE